MPLPKITGPNSPCSRVWLPGKPIGIGLEIKVAAVRSVVVTLDDQVVAKVLLNGKHPNLRMRLIHVILDP